MSFSKIKYIKILEDISSDYFNKKEPANYYIMSGEIKIFKVIKNPEIIFKTFSTVPGAGRWYFKDSPILSPDELFKYLEKDDIIHLVHNLDILNNISDWHTYGVMDDLG